MCTKYPELGSGAEGVRPNRDGKALAAAQQRSRRHQDVPDVVEGDLALKKKDTAGRCTEDLNAMSSQGVLKDKKAICWC